MRTQHRHSRPRSLRPSAETPFADAEFGNHGPLDETVHLETEPLTKGGARSLRLRIATNRAKTECLDADASERLVV